MASFTYYIINVDSGEVHGTDYEDVAKAFAMDDEMFVINVPKNVLLQSNGDEDPIVEFEPSEGDADDVFVEDDPET